MEIVLSKEKGKYQESIQTSAIPDPGHHMGKRQKLNKTSHNKRAKRWNALPQATRELSSMECFINQLNSDIIPPQKLYFQGNRLAQIYHARLRNGCITLRLYLD